MHIRLERIFVVSREDEQKRTHTVLAEGWCSVSVPLISSVAIRTLAMLVPQTSSFASTGDGAGEWE